MPSIHWYPGHIAKAERKLHEQLNLVDVILEVTDARIPLSSKYEDNKKLTGDKPRLLLMSKADLADQQLSSEWKEYLEKNEHIQVILTSSTSSKDISSVIRVAIELGKPKIDELVAKGRLPRPIRAMVIGMPNVGKSSMINKLIKTAKVKTGAKAGVTRIAQWVRVNPKLELLDMPGLIPPKLTDESKAVKLAIVNSVSEKAYDNVEIAQELIKILYEMYPEKLLGYYKLGGLDHIPTISEIAKARNWISLGEEPDINRCAASVLSDFRHGKIGRMTLENVPES